MSRYAMAHPRARRSNRTRGPASLVLGKRSSGRAFIATPEERSTHLHVIGASGRGKSFFLEHLIREDIFAGRGVCVIDPHGELYDNLVRWCANNRLDRVHRIHLFEPTTAGWTFGFNPLKTATRDPAEVATVTNAMILAIARSWDEDLRRTPQLKDNLGLILSTLAYHGLTLVESDELTRADDPEGIRAHLVETLPEHEPHFHKMRLDWEKVERRARSPAVWEEHFGSTSRRLSEFLRNPLMAVTLGQATRTLDFFQLMEQGDVLLVNLAPRAGLPIDTIRTLGALMVSSFYVNALRRRPGHAKPFYLYLDECYWFLNDDIPNILVQTRKFGLHMILAHQNLGQLKHAGELVYDGVMEGAQMKAVFGGLGMESATALALDLFKLDLNQIKPSTVRPIAVGTRITTLSSWGATETETNTAGTHQSQSTTNSASQSELESATSRLEQSMFGGSEPFLLVQGTGSGQASGTASAAGSMIAQGRARGFIEGTHETLEPVYEDHGEPYSLEEQTYLKALTLRYQLTQYCVVQLPGQEGVCIKTPTIIKPVEWEEARSGFQKRALRASPFAIPEHEARREIMARTEELRRRATAQNFPDTPALAPEHQSPGHAQPSAAGHPQDDDDFLE